MIRGLGFRSPVCSVGNDQFHRWGNNVCISETVVGPRQEAVVERLYRRVPNAESLG